MDRKTIINYDKGMFMDFLENDNTGQILELLNDEGVELLNKYKYTSERINYILCYSKYCNELFQNEKFLDLFLNTDISDYYANLHMLNKDTYDKIIKRCLELKKDNNFIAKLFNYFNKEYKLNTIDNWPYSIDLIYEVFKIDLEDLGPKIMQKYDIDFMSHDISIENIFNRNKDLALKEISNRNNGLSKIETIYIPEHKITKEMVKKLWNKHNVYEYRKIVNEAAYTCNPDKLNKYAKEEEDRIISSTKENGLTESINKIYELIIKSSTLDESSDEYQNINNSIIDIISKARLYDIGLEINRLKIEDIDKVKEFLEKASNHIISNYIIDYHFEENYFNIMYDMRELLDFYYAGNINIPEERLSLYEKISHIDELSIQDRKELHEELKKYNMIELFYDDMFYARKTVREAIKDYSLTREVMSEYRDEELSKEYGVDVYNIKDNPFFAVVKTGRHFPDKLPTGHSYSLVGSGCIGVFGNVEDSETFVYDSDNLNSDQIVHVYPMDSFTLYKPFCYSEQATNRVQTLMMPDELLKETTSYNEILLLEQGREVTDMDKKIPELKRMALYCVDKITKRDVEVAEANGIGIFLVSSKDYHKGYDMPSNIYRHANRNEDYWNKNYFDGSFFEEEKHERNR